MIDLIFQGTKANIATLLRDRGLTDADNVPQEGFEACWWAGDGRFMTAKPVFGNGQLNPPTVAATYLTGFVLLARIHGQRFVADRIDSADAEQWSRSQIAKWIKDNGVLGTFGDIACYTVASVRLFRASEVFAWLAANDLPGHEWAGGNTL